MLLLVGASSLSYAGGVSAPGVIGGPDAGAATASPIAPHYNPAALGGVTAPRVLLDALDEPFLAVPMSLAATLLLLVLSPVLLAQVWGLRRMPASPLNA